MADLPNDEAPRWLDDFENVKKVYRAVWIGCIVLLVAGEAALVAARANPHGEHHGFGFESWPGFYSFFGFVACFALVLAAKQLRKLLMRDEDYYEAAPEEPPHGH